MRNLYESGMDILGGGHVIGRGGHRGGGHRGGGGFRGGRFFGPRGGWGWGWPGYYDRGDTYIVDYVDVDDDDEDEDDDVLGMIDIQSRQAEMNKLKNPTVGISQVLLKYGQQAIDLAINGSKQSWYKPDLPGGGERQNTKGHLQWHANELAKYAATPNAFYPNAEDLKKWVMEAYVEANATEEGGIQTDAIWGRMWTEIAAALDKLPKQIADKVNEVFPTWVKWTAAGVGGITALGLGLGIYRVVTR